MCDLDYGDGAEVWKDTRRKARKPHRCSACAATIEAGQTYVHHVSIYDGSTNTEKICAACEAARDRFEEEHEVGIAPSALPDLLRECFQERSRDWWTKEDKAWRRDLAAIKWRNRAARRAASLKGEGGR